MGEELSLKEKIDIFKNLHGSIRQRILIPGLLREIVDYAYNVGRHVVCNDDSNVKSNIYKELGMEE